MKIIRSCINPCTSESQGNYTNKVPGVQVVSKYEIWSEQPLGGHTAVLPFFQVARGRAHNILFLSIVKYSAELMCCQVHFAAQPDDVHQCGIRELCFGFALQLTRRQRLSPRCLRKSNGRTVRRHCLAIKARRDSPKFRQ